jgi:hypothetical protein
MSNICYVWIGKYSEEMHCSECQIYLTLANMKRITLLFMIWILFDIWRNQRFETAGDHECAKSFKHSYKSALGGSVWGTKVFVTGCNASLLSWNLSECRHFQSISNTELDSEVHRSCGGGDLRDMVVVSETRDLYRFQCWTRTHNDHSPSVNVSIRKKKK